MLLQDVRYAFRSIWHNKGFSLVVILCLGIGIGVNTTIFSVVDGVLVQPFPYVESHRLLVVDMVNPKVDPENGSLSYLDVRDLKEQNTVFTSMTSVTGRSLTISDGGEPGRYRGGAISWDLFSTLGIQPVAGRLFTATDDRLGAEDVLLLSHDVWLQRYQGDASAIDKRVLVNGKPYTIVGVMPPRFAFPENRQVWVPLTPTAGRNARDNRELYLTMGRLKPEASFERAQEDIRSVAARLETTYPDTNKGQQGRVRNLRDEFIPTDVSTVIWLMMGASTLVLFIACSNVANLLLARATVRRREISVRAALGAGRARIIRQLLTESVVYGLASVPLGLAIGLLGTQLLTSSMPPDQVPYYIQWRVDWRTMAYTVAVAMLTAVVFGLVPAIRGTRGALHESLKEGTRGNSGARSWVRDGLVVVQIALAIVSLVGAALFVRTFVNLNDYVVGFDAKPLMTMRFFMPGEAYEPADAKGRRVEDVVRRIEQLPGVQAAFASNMIPLSGGGGGGDVVIDGQTFEKGQEPSISLVGVTPHFLQTLGVTPTLGRNFTEAEAWARTPFAVINTTMARQFWPTTDPLGRRFRLSGADESADWFTVIGVIADIKQSEVDPGEEPFPSAFIPYLYQQTPNTGLTIRVASGDPASITSAVRGAIRASESNLPIFAVQTMEQARRLGFWQYAIFGWVFSIIGGVALILASVGVYGVLSYAVSQRTQEIGVRVALGANDSDVLRLVLRQGLILAGVGVVVGLGFSAVATQGAKSLLYNVSPTDPASFALVSAFLMSVAAFASWVPARRATRVDPVVALRGE